MESGKTHARLHASFRGVSNIPALWQLDTPGGTAVLIVLSFAGYRYLPDDMTMSDFVDPTMSRSSRVS